MGQFINKIITITRLWWAEDHHHRQHDHITEPYDWLDNQPRPNGWIISGHKGEREETRNSPEQRGDHRRHEAVIALQCRSWSGWGGSPLKPIVVELTKKDESGQNSYRQQQQRLGIGLQSRGATNQIKNLKECHCGRRLGLHAYNKERNIIWKDTVVFTILCSRL